MWARQWCRELERNIPQRGTGCPRTGQSGAARVVWAGGGSRGCGGRGRGVHRTLRAEGGQVDPHKPPGKLAVSTPVEHFPTHQPAAQEPASYESKDAHAYDHREPLCRQGPLRMASTVLIHSSTPIQEQPNTPTHRPLECVRTGAWTQQQKGTHPRYANKMNLTNVLLTVSYRSQTPKPHPGGFRWGRSNHPQVVEVRGATALGNCWGQGRGLLADVHAGWAGKRKGHEWHSVCPRPWLCINEASILRGQHGEVVPRGRDSRAPSLGVVSAPVLRHPYLSTRTWTPCRKTATQNQTSRTKSPQTNLRFLKSGWVRQNSGQLLTSGLWAKTRRDCSTAVESRPGLSEAQRAATRRGPRHPFSRSRKAAGRRLLPAGSEIDSGPPLPTLGH